ncbi:MAG: endo-1,4-beta-xylanase [Phycisphaeraceae bacterium]|nr:endo-1,4-beta-xylanase [Phycisphaeraceae bacterium]
MQSFVVFDTEEIDARHFPPRHAYLVGPDETPVQGEIVFREGVVDATKFVQATVGLCVQMAVRLPSSNGGEGQGADLGVLCVQTCLLPDRTQPYLLTIELARRQIMMVLNKMEDWGLFDLSAQTPSFEQFERARQMFTRALVAQKGDGHEPTREGYCAKADALAGDALALSLSAGEGLTLINAERQLKQRLSGAGYEAAVAHLARLTPERPPAGAPIVVPGAGHCVLSEAPAIGCAVSPVQFTEAQQKAVLATCDFVTMPMRWIDMEPTEGRYNFGATDRWIEWAIRTAKLPVVGGPLVDFRPQCAPDWLFIWENDYETLRDLVYEHVQAVVTRYRRTVSRWTVASGLHVNTNFKISFEQIIDLTKMCVQIVRRLHPAAKVVLEVAQPWGEYHALNRRSIPPFVYAEAVVQVGAASLASHVDAIGLRMQMGNAEPGNATRDLMAFSAALDRYANLEKPIAITALGAPSSMITPKPYRPRAGAEPTDPYEPGFWRQPWSEAQQAEWLAQVMTIAASKPYVQSICWQELSDGPGGLGPEMPTGGLMHAGGAAKPSLVRLAQIRKAIKEGRWPLNPAS